MLSTWSHGQYLILQFCTGNVVRVNGRVKPQSHRIVRFLDRTIGCDWAMVRPIGNVCYDLQQAAAVVYRDRSLRVVALSRSIGEYR